MTGRISLEQFDCYIKQSRTSVVEFIVFSELVKGVLSILDDMNVNVLNVKENGKLTTITIGPSNAAHS